MFSTWKQRLVLGVYIFLVLSIPIGSYLVSQQTQTKSKASEGLQTLGSSPSAIIGASGSASPRDEIRNLLLSSPTPSPSPSTTNPTSTASPSSAISFGPTLNFKLSLEGRPTNKQSGKVFVGINEGVISGKQSTYLLSFTVDLLDSGSYEGISLAGLDSGKQYTAYIKSASQIATSSAFIMSPGITALNSNKTISLLTGDLNEDNVINDADYTIAKAAYGTQTGGINWNPNVDFNLDGIVNNGDLYYILKNMLKIGVSGPWISSASAQLKTTPNTGAAKDELIPQLAPDGQHGYWIWVPKNNP